MEKEAVDSSQSSSLCPSGGTGPPEGGWEGGGVVVEEGVGGSVFSRELVFANEQLASHSYPPCRDGTVLASFYLPRVTNGKKERALTEL